MKKEKGNHADEQDKTIFILFKNSYLDTDKLYFCYVFDVHYLLLSGVYEKGL